MLATTCYYCEFWRSRHAITNGTIPSNLLKEIFKFLSNFRYPGIQHHLPSLLFFLVRSAIERVQPHIQQAAIMEPKAIVMYLLLRH